MIPLYNLHLQRCKDHIHGIYSGKWSFISPTCCRDSVVTTWAPLEEFRHLPPILTNIPTTPGRTHKMPSLVVPESGLSIGSSRNASSKAGPAHDVFSLTLSDSVIEEMIRCVQKGKLIQLSLGEHPVSFSSPLFSYIVVADLSELTACSGMVALVEDEHNSSSTSSHNIC